MKRKIKLWFFRKVKQLANKVIDITDEACVRNGFFLYSVTEELENYVK